MVGLLVELEGATTLRAGSQAAVSGAPDIIWEIIEDVTSSAPGFYPALARCLTVGPILAPSGSI